VNPSNPRHLNVIAMTGSATTSTSRGDYGACMVTASFDGGMTWLPPDSVGGGAGGCADPWLVTLRSGVVVAAVLGDSGIEIYRSPDGGRRWQTGARLRGAFDHEMLLRAPDGQSVMLVAALSLRDRERRPRGAIYVGLSHDGGLTFREQARPVFSNLSYEATTPVLLSDGRLAVPFGDHRRWNGQRLTRRRQWLAVSADTGRSFDVPMLITEECNEQRGLPIGWPSTAVAAAKDGASEQLIFACEGPDARAIVVTTSSNAGDSWSNTIAIQSAETPQAIAKVPVLAAFDQTVALGFKYKTSDSSSTCHRLFGTISRDGGRTFATIRPWASGPSCPTADSNRAGVLRRFPFGGDYFGLVPLTANTFYAVWADARAGRFELRGAQLVVSP
jgi:hypothetical protein